MLYPSLPHRHLDRCQFVAPAELGARGSERLIENAVHRRRWTIARHVSPISLLAFLHCVYVWTGFSFLWNFRRLVPIRTVSVYTALRPAVHSDTSQHDPARSTSRSKPASSSWESFSFCLCERMKWNATEMPHTPAIFTHFSHGFIGERKAI